VCACHGGVQRCVVCVCVFVCVMVLQRCVGCACMCHHCVVEEYKGGKGVFVSCVVRSVCSALYLIIS
jgi:hypothetical protein